MSYITFRDSSNINKNHLDKRFSNHFQSDCLIDKISYELCQASFLSKKEYCESIEVVRIIQRFFKSGRKINIYDICGGHGFVGILLSVLSDSVINTYIVDLKKPPSFDRIMTVIEKIAPDKAKKIEFIQKDFRDVDYEENSLLIGVHACGMMSDDIMEIAFNKNESVCILPCCYKHNSLPGKLKRFKDIYQMSDVIDLHRVHKSINNNYNPFIRLVPEKITPKNKLFMFLPDGSKYL